MTLISSFMQVPLLLPEELRDEVLSGAAEIVVEHGGRDRCFLHIYSEDERLTKIEDMKDPQDIVRQAHEAHLTQLRWARGVLWTDARVQRFVRHADHLLWPSYESLSKIIDVVRQLSLCEDGENTSVLRKAHDFATANRILRQEATLPGLHPLKKTTLEGHAALYDVQQTRKRSRDPWSATMPSLLSRVDEESVDSVAYIAEMTQVSYAVSDVLRLQFASTPMGRLVELLVPPQRSPAATATSVPAVPVVRQQWRGFLDKHRKWAEYHSLFADVEEYCRFWGISEACVARDVHAALARGDSVQLRSGIHASVLQRAELFLLVSPRARKIDSVVAAEKTAFASLFPTRSWSECVDEGMVRMVTRPPTGLTPAALEAFARQLFLSPALSDVQFRECCTVSEVRGVSAELEAIHLSSTFNPFVVVHGTRVCNGFTGDISYFAVLQRHRDRLVTEQTNAQLRRGLHEAPNRGTSGPSSDTVSTTLPSQTPQRTPLRITGDAAVAAFNRALISALAVAPLSRTEIQNHPSMREYRGAANYETVLKMALKENTEFKGRRYHLRD